VLKNVGLFFLVLIAIGISASAQSGTCVQSVIVNARDRRGNFVRGIQAANFLVKVRRHDAKVLSVGTGPRTHRVVIVLDTSGSMASGLRPSISRFMTGELVHSLPGDSHFALIVFAGRVLEKIPFGHAGEETNSAIDRATAARHAGQTSLWDALLQAADLFGAPQFGDSIVVATDSDDNYSKTSRDLLQRACVAKGIRIYFFQFIDHYFASEEEGGGAQIASILTEEVGGFGVNVGDLSPAQEFIATHNIEDLIANYYILKISRSDNGEKVSDLQISLVGPSGHKRKDAELIFPHKVPGCGLVVADTRR
jgi:Mg-chelatase subunit ChlD